MSLFAPKQSNSRQNTKLFGYPVQTSIYGSVIPIQYGTNRISGNVLWVGDWKANPVKTGGKGGPLGKGSGSGKGGSGSQQYTYQASIIIGLCRGTVTGLGHIWIDKTRMAVKTSTDTITVPSGGGTYTPPSQRSNVIVNHGVSRRDSYSQTANDYGSPGTITLSGTQRTPMKPVASNPGAGEYAYNPITGTWTFSSADAGKTIEVTYVWTQQTTSGTGDPVADLNLSLFEGTQGQAAWDYLTSAHPDQALGYTELAYVAASPLDLGSTGLVSNYNFEVFGKLQYGGGIVDAEPGAVIVDVLTNPLTGVGWDINEIGDTTEFSKYCAALNLFVSPTFDSQRTVADFIKELTDIGNGEVVWSQGKLKLRSYGDTTEVGNGVTFTPNTTPIYDLSYDDFLCNKGEMPITIARTSVKDGYNKVTVEWRNRANDYLTEPLDQQDDWSVQSFGLRPMSNLSYPAVTSQYVAAKVASTKVQRLVYIRNTPIKFKLPWKYILLEPMDLVTVTDPNFGWVKHPVRILTITENENFELEVEAEDFPWGTATPTLYPKQVTSSFGPGYYADPGATHAPIFWEAVSEQSQEQRYLLQIALSGGNNWGGATVWVSSDGTNYTALGKQNGPATMGLIAADLSDHADPDDASTLTVDLSQSGGELQSYTLQQENSFIPLVLVDQELIAYRTATLVAPNKYNLTHLRRGCFGTPIQPHASGAQFLFFDSGVFTWKYDTTDIREVRYFKFTSFNSAGQMEQPLENATAYQYRIRGPRRPYPWHTTDTHPLVTDPLVKASTFGTQLAYATWTDGRVQPQIFVTGHMIKNVVSSKTRPPTIAFVSTASTGGFIPGGTTLLVAATGYGSDGLETDLSPILTVQIPTGTNTNTATFSIQYASNTDTSGTVYIAVNDDTNGMVGALALAGTDTQFTLYNSVLNGQSSPDMLTKKYLLQARGIPHAGCYGATVSSITSSYVEVTGSNWTSDQMVGRVLSLVFKHDGSKIPLVNATITSNTSDRLYLDADLTSVVVAGDVFIIRSKVTSFTSNTITDAALVNGGAGQPGTGLDTDSDKGNMVMAIYGAGVGTPAIPIISNTADTYTLAAPHPFDTTTIFIVVEQNWSTLQPTDSNAVSGVSSMNVAIGVDNTYQKTWQVQVLTVDTNGLASADEVSPFREVFVPGKGSPGLTASQIIITHADSPYSMTGDFSQVECDTSGGDIVINVVSAAQLPLGDYTISKAPPADNHTVTINAAANETFDGVNSQVILSLPNDIAGEGVFEFHPVH